MKTEWKEELLSRQPIEFEKVNRSIWIQRRNVRQNLNQEVGGYICESRFLSDDVKEEVMRMQEVITDDRGTSLSNKEITECLGDMMYELSCLELGLL